MRLYLPLILPILISCTACDNGTQLSNGDLLFQLNEGSDFTNAIIDATTGNGEIDFSHVGIFTLLDGDSVVIEATSKYGVTSTPLTDFLNRSHRINGKPAVIAMRLTEDGIDLEKATARALSHIGEPYDWAFMPENGKMYCSELVEVSYLRNDSTSVFETIPMNFLDPNGNMPQFWIDLYESIGLPIPQGMAGTNPNSIYNSPSLKEVKRYF